MGFLAFLNMLFLKALGLVMSLAMAWSVPAASAEPYAPEDAAGLLLQLSVISDVHMETNNFELFPGFAKALQGIGNAKVKSDALLLLGDNTTNGQTMEYIYLYSLLSQYNEINKTIVAMGNHDMNPSLWDAQYAIKKHNFYLRSYTSEAHDTPYYSTKVKGCTFIVLGDEKSNEDTTATISQAQLDWFAKTMQESEPGKPIFILSHQPLEHAFGRYWVGIGEQSEAICAIAESYPNVFYFSGHLHWPEDVMSIDGVTYINVPTLLKDKGVGFQAEVYENRVVLKARNYLTDQWVDGERYEIALTS